MIAEIIRGLRVGVELLGVVVAAAWPVAAAENALRIPDALHGPVYDLEMRAGTTQLQATGVPTRTAGYNGSILGPTLIMNTGDFVTLNVRNGLNESTTTHWHGM
ncbi:MAG: multicopper oxidase domain-containing protein [Verrucomicrobia bacterium]|nr:multicopper oxidase domain-containing protein [Verrucomicrobiota bacterium]